MLESRVFTGCTCGTDQAARSAGIVHRTHVRHQSCTGVAQGWESRRPSDRRYVHPEQSVVSERGRGRAALERYRTMMCVTSIRMKSTNITPNMLPADDGDPAHVPLDVGVFLDGTGGQQAGRLGATSAGRGRVGPTLVAARSPGRAGRLLGKKLRLELGRAGLLGRGEGSSALGGDGGAGGRRRAVRGSLGPTGRALLAGPRRTARAFRHVEEPPPG